MWQVFTINYYRPHPLTSPPPQVLIKKSYGDSKKRHKRRNWQLQSMDKERAGLGEELEDEEKDYLDFLEDLEEDQSYRQGVNIYKSKCGHVTVRPLVVNMLLLILFRAQFSSCH